MKRTKNNLDTLKNIWNIAIGVTLSIVTFALSKDKIIELYGADKIHFISTVTLSVLALVEFFIYMISTGREMTILDNYINADSIPRLRPRVLLTILAISIAFGFLIVFSHNILIFSICLIIFNVFDNLGEIQISGYTRERIIEERTKAKDKKVKKCLDALERYFDLHRIFLIQFISSTANWIALCFSLIFYFTNDESYRIIATIIIVLNLIISELVVNSNRIKRDRILEENE